MPKMEQKDVRELTVDELDAVSGDVVTIEYL